MMTSRVRAAAQALALAAVGVGAALPARAQDNTPFGDRFRRPADFENLILAPNDDGSVQATLGFLIDYFGARYSSTFVNNNGNLTFGSALSSYTPDASFFGGSTTVTPIPIIAPFFADVDTRGLGSSPVVYGRATIDGRPAFIANYENVGYFAVNADKLNSFQVVLIDRSNVQAGAFDVEFNYNSIEWETGDASGGVDGLGGQSAFAGLSAGTGAPGTFFTVPGSGQNGAFLNANTMTGLVHANNGTGRITALIRNGEIFFATTGEVPDEGNLRVALTGSDPVSGSPTGALALQSFDDFAMGAGLADESAFESQSAFTTGMAAHSAFVALQGGVVTTGDIDTTVATAPLSYRYATPRRPLGISNIRVQLPITFTQSDDNGVSQGAYGMSAGIGAEREMIGPWAIVPAVRVGFVRAGDSHTGAITYGASITNKLTFGLRNRITIGNVVSYYRAEDSDVIQREAVSLDLEQVIIKTGVVGQTVVMMGARPLGLRGFVAHTATEGDESFADEYYEAGATIAARASRAGFDSQGMEFGLKGVFGDDVSGVLGTFGFRF